MRTYRRTASIFTGIIFAIIGIVMVVIAFVLSNNEQQFIRTATHVTGTVTQLLTSTDSKNNSSYKPVVQFTTTDGQEITYTSNISSNPSPYSIGQKVDIYYDPANPHSVVIAGQTGLIYLIVGGMGGLFALIGVATVFFRIVRGR